MDLFTSLVLGFFGLVVILIAGIIRWGYARQAKLEDVEKMMGNGRFRDAIPLLERLIDEDERDCQKNYMLAECHEKLGEYQNAILQYRRILKFGRWSPPVTEIVVQKKLAECLKQTANLTEAKNEYLILTKLEPNNYEPFYEAALLFQRGKALPNALKFFKQAASLNPGHFGTLHGMGRVLFGMNVYSDAKDALRRAAEIEPGNRQNLYYLGQAHRFLGESHKALEAFDLAEQGEAYRVRSILAKALVLIDRGEYSEAMVELERGLSYAEEKSEYWLQIHYLLAGLAERAKDVGVAIEHWEKINSANQNYRDVAIKLKQYGEFRTNDQIKDLLIAGRVQFEAIARKIAQNMSLRPVNVRIHNDSMLTLTCREDQTRKAFQSQNVLIRVYREMFPVSESQVREFHDMMKSENAARGIYLTIGEFAPSAQEYASNRPIDLMDGSSVVSMIREAIG